MDEEQFQKAIAPYTKVQVDRENPQIKKYVFNYDSDNHTIRLDKKQRYKSVPRTGKKILKTPLGRFESVPEAAQAHAVSAAMIYYRLKRDKEYYFEK